jgi:hypothetical protein
MTPTTIDKMGADDDSVDRDPVDLVIHKRFADAAVRVVSAVATANQFEKTRRCLRAQVLEQLEVYFW